MRKNISQLDLTSILTGTVGIDRCGRSKHSDCSLFWPQLSRGGENQWYIASLLLLEQNIWQEWSLVFFPTKLSVLLKSNFLHQSKKYNNFWGMWPSGHVGHVFINMLFISTEIFHDKLPPQILLVGTTANAALRRTSKIIKSCLPNCYGFTKRGHQTSLILQLFMVL
jgi:hypothetical protein